MSIYLILGRPGGGKSYEATVYHALESLKQGRRVITNLPLNIPMFEQVFGAEFIAEHLEVRTEAKGPAPNIKANGINWKRSPTDKVIRKPFSTVDCYQDEWRHPDSGIGALFIVDECHFVLPRGSTPIEVSNWYSMHRHHGFDILLISQGYRKINVDIIDMVDLVYFLQKNKMLGDEGSYTRKIKDGVRGAIVNSDTRTYQKEYFKYYKSHTASNSSVTEAYAQDIKGFWQGGLIRTSIGLFVLVGISVIYNLSSTGDVEPEIIEPVTEVHSRNQESRQAILDRINKNRGERSEHSTVLGSNVASVPASSSPVEVELVEQKKVKRDHPFSRFEIIIKGRFYMNDHEDFFLLATQNGQPVFSMTMRDLYMAGYSIVVLGDCAIEVSYKDFYTNFLNCGSSNVSMTGQTASN